MLPGMNSACAPVEATAGEEQPTVKRAKLGVTGVFRDSLFTPESRRQLRAAFETAQPYTHLVFQQLCDPALLRQVREEVINNVNATYKETDLFKVFQTGAWGSRAYGSV